MKAFLLAAGKGSRISKNIPNIPKCTLDVGGKPLIRKTVEMLLENGIDVTVIVGYRYREIIRVLEGCPVHIVHNPFYDVTNSIGSLWMAENLGLFSEEDTIIANGDVFWSQEILDFMKRKVPEGDVYMLGDSNRVLDGDYFFGTENGYLKRYGKELTVEERDCEYVGIAYVSAAFIPVFLKRLNEMIDEQCHGKWWEDAIYSLSDVHPIPVKDIAGMFWAEVDFIEDYRRILDYVREKTGIETNGSITTFDHK
ncbi:MAG: phosphocholine cytidylyltransferase family protein [Clostridium sp.]|nr:phosphocholine cytidylyltransferase family protein [Clostridium sp.]MCI6887958.1 phosphocholine cytidylyltransferase family protein [Lachnospiraceae bacterium]